MREAELRGERLPRAAQVAQAGIVLWQRMQRIKQAVGRARLREAFRARPLCHKPRCQMRGKAPADRRISRRRAAQRCRGVHRDEARGSRDGVAMVARLK